MPNKFKADLMDDEYVWEIDFGGHKVFEAIGQALVYSFYSGKKPGVVILTRSDNEANKLREAFKPVLDEHNIKLVHYKIVDKHKGEIVDDSGELLYAGNFKE